MSTDKCPDRIAGNHQWVVDEGMWCCIWCGEERLYPPDPRSAEQVREDKGCEAYHAMRDGE